MKFGGTSVGSFESIQQVKEIILSDERRSVVVLSAFSGVTNLLVKINEQHEESDASVLMSISNLKERCLEIINPLFTNPSSLDKAHTFLNERIELIDSLVRSDFDQLHQKTIIAQGEIISTSIFQLFLEQCGTKSQLLSSLDFMWLDENNEPDLRVIQNKLNPILDNSSHNLFITQGFICNDIDNNISNLERGGSDYTASLIGAALNSDEIQIWTDIDGFHNNDPRFVDNTHAIANLSKFIYDFFKEIQMIFIQIL